MMFKGGVGPGWVVGGCGLKGVQWLRASGSLWGGEWPVARMLSTGRHSWWVGRVQRFDGPGSMLNIACCVAMAALWVLSPIITCETHMFWDWPIGALLMMV